ncbi:MAG: PrsW family intramembrane metalloprotease [Acidimicrobiales bacterium]|jgi:RsiW-degrading membrane proteinase PrsW (M82 family)|nr:PrsW family intramembrane metalloprotease [Acidimicrobiales bacterium]
MTAPVDAAADRSAAIEASGFGRTFSLVQTHNMGFWVYLLLVVVGLLAMFQQFQGPLAAFEGSLVFSVGLFAAYTVPFWLFLRHIDRFDSVPEKLAVAAFVYGGVVATFAMATYANNAVISLWGKANGQQFAADWAAALTAPFTEELAKASGLVLLVLLAPRLIRTAFDGLIVGAFLGLGFQVFEDVIYGVHSAYGDFGVDAVASTYTTSVMRVVVGLTSHWTYSAIFCAGLIYVIGRPDEPRRIGRGLLLMFAAMALHGLWDATGGLAGISPILFPLVYLFVPVTLIALFVWIYKTSVVTERRWMRELMEPEVALGVLTQADVDALAGSRKQRKAYVKAHAGHKSHVHAKHVLDAAGDLATQIARDGGADSDRVRFARAELLRVKNA